MFKFRCVLTIWKSQLAHALHLFNRCSKLHETACTWATTHIIGNVACTPSSSHTPISLCNAHRQEQFHAVMLSQTSHCISFYIKDAINSYTSPSGLQHQRDKPPQLYALLPHLPILPPPFPPPRPHPREKYRLHMHTCSGMAGNSFTTCYLQYNAERISFVCSSALQWLQVISAGWTLSPLQPEYLEGRPSHQCLVTLVLKLDLGGWLTSSSSSFMAALLQPFMNTFVGHSVRNAFLEPLLTSVISLRDKVHNRPHPSHTLSQALAQLLAGSQHLLNCSIHKQLKPSVATYTTERLLKKAQPRLQCLARLTCPE